jgi:hypothetical protein
MYLMYVDESGDCGMPSAGSPSTLFCLSGLVVHELRWRDTMSQLLSFRHWLKGRYKVYLDDELHAAEMIAKPSKIAPSLQRLSKHERLAIIRNFADEIAALSDVSIINVVVDKRSGRVPNKDEVFRRAWYDPLPEFPRAEERGRPRDCVPGRYGRPEAAQVSRRDALQEPAESAAKTRSVRGSQ